MDTEEMELNFLVTDIYLAIGKAFPGDANRSKRITLYTAIERAVDNR